MVWKNGLVLNNSPQVALLTTSPRSWTMQKVCGCLILIPTSLTPSEYDWLCDLTSLDLQDYQTYCRYFTENASEFEAIY